MEKRLLTQAKEIINQTLKLDLSEVKGPFFHNENSWKEYVSTNSLNYQADGVFIPESMQAHVCKERKFSEVTTLHEYIGHGLFYQHAELGRALREKYVEQENLKGEYKVKAKAELEGVIKERRPFIEGFALWTEKYLLKSLNQTKKWKQRHTTYKKDELKNLEVVEKEENKFGALGIFYGTGIPKNYNSAEIIQICNSYFKEKAKEIELIILFGSRKPKSDIDLLVVGNLPEEQVYTSWLDMHVQPSELFTVNITNFDLLTLSAIANGSAVMGNKNTLSQLKEKIKKQPSTLNAINYNKWRSLKARENILKGNFYNLKGAIRTVVSCEVQAQKLEKGKPFLSIEEMRKAFPLEEIVENIHRRTKT